MKMKMKISCLFPLLFIIAIIDTGFVRLVDCALVRLEKHCFTEGEAITIRFIDIEGEGVFIGLYEKSAVPDLTQLPGLASDSLKDWVLTCGDLDNCDNWPTQGIVQLSTFGLEETEYVIAVSGDRSGLVPQSTTKTFRVGDCSSSSTFFSVPTLSPSRPIILGPTQPTINQAPSVQPIQVSNPLPTPVSVPVVSEAALDTVLVVSDTINSVIQEARDQILDLIRSDGDFVGKVSFSTRVG
ncbi:MAG: hypothetical protein ACI90V_004166 [Bacillariaceae sp.]|jgi:hypothetical protein